MTNEDRNILFLIATNCVNKVFDVFMGVFMVSFLFKTTTGSIVQIGIFNLICGLIVGAFLTYDSEKDSVESTSIKSNVFPSPMTNNSYPQPKPNT